MNGLNLHDVRTQLSHPRATTTSRLLWLCVLDSWRNQKQGLKSLKLNEWKEQQQQQQQEEEEEEE